MTGSRQHTGNYAGVTVEKKEGRRSRGDVEFIVYDLPGTYSLTAYSTDEVIARDFILQEKPDVIVDVLDATNMERNLYLCLQILELGIPVVGALNIADQAETMGIRIDDKKLATLLGIPLVRTVGTKNNGIEALLDCIAEAAREGNADNRCISYGVEMEVEIAALTREIARTPDVPRDWSPRWLAIKLLEKDADARARLDTSQNRVAVETAATESIRRIEKHFGRDAEIVVSEQRYAYVHGIVAEAVRSTSGKDFSVVSEAIDTVLLHRILGLPLFLLFMWAIFQVTFKLGRFATDGLNVFFANVSSFIAAVVPAGIFHSFLIDGIMGGLCGVLAFVPQIAILFLFLSSSLKTADTWRAPPSSWTSSSIYSGYTDSRSCRSSSGLAASVPAVMASRTLKSSALSRIITVLVTPFMTCGAKLVVLVFIRPGPSSGTTRAPGCCSFIASAWPSRSSHPSFSGKPLRGGARLLSWSCRPTACRPGAVLRGTSWTGPALLPKGRDRAACGLDPRLGSSIVSPPSRQWSRQRPCRCGKATVRKLCRTGRQGHRAYRQANGVRLEDRHIRRDRLRGKGGGGFHARRAVQSWVRRGRKRAEPAPIDTGRSHVQPAPSRSY